MSITSETNSRKIKTRVLTPTSDSLILNVFKQTNQDSSKSVLRKTSFKKLKNEVSHSTKNDPLFKSSKKVKESSFNTRRGSSTADFNWVNCVPNNLEGSLNEEDEVFPLINKESISNEERSERKKSRSKTCRETPDFHSNFYSHKEKAGSSKLVSHSEDVFPSIKREPSSDEDFSDLSRTYSQTLDFNSNLYNNTNKASSSRSTYYSENVLTSIKREPISDESFSEVKKSRTCSKTLDFNSSLHNNTNKAGSSRSTYYSENVLPSIKREPTSDESFSEKKFRTHSQTLDVHSSLHYNTNKAGSSRSTYYSENVLTSIKREPSSDESFSEEKSMTCSQTLDSHSSLHNNTKKAGSSRFTSYSESDLPSIKTEPTSDESFSEKKNSRTHSQTLDFNSSLHNNTNKAGSSRSTSYSESELPSIKREPTSDDSCSEVRKSNIERKYQTLPSPKKPKRKRRCFESSPPTTPYVLNRPQRNRVPPLAFWKGEHRTFRHFRNGDVVLVAYQGPDNSVKPQVKKQKPSEMNCLKVKVEVTVS